MASWKTALAALAACTAAQGIVRAEAPTAFTRPGVEETTPSAPQPVSTLTPPPAPAQVEQPANAAAQPTTRPGDAATQARDAATKRLHDKAEGMKVEGLAVSKMIYSSSGGPAFHHIARIDYDVAFQQNAFAGPQVFHHVWDVKSNHFTFDGPLLHNPRLDPKVLARVKAEQAEADRLFALPLMITGQGVAVRQLPTDTPGGPTLNFPVPGEEYSPSVIQEQVDWDGRQYILGVNGNTKRILWSYPSKDYRADGPVLVWRNYQQYGPVILSATRYTPDRVPAVSYNNIVVTPERAGSSAATQGAAATTAP